MSALNVLLFGMLLFAMARPADRETDIKDISRLRSVPSALPWPPRVVLPLVRGLGGASNGP